MILKLEGFIKQIRQKAYFFETFNHIDDATAVNDFEFKAFLTPPKINISTQLKKTYTPVA